MSQPPGGPFFLIPGPPNTSSTQYNGKIIIASLALLCFVVLFILGLHIYAKWFWRRSQRRQDILWRRRQPLHVPAEQPATVGLDRAIIDSLPTFVYKLSQKGSMECAVCLSELQENDEGRLLPKCNHSFHSECIDMWFLSHTTCPLCRTSADPTESRPSSDERAHELELGAPHVGELAIGLRTTISDEVDGSRGSDRPIVEGARAEPLPSPGWGWRRSISDRFSQNPHTGVQFPTNVLFWGNNSHVRSHTNAPQLTIPRLEHGQRGARSLPHMALDIPRTMQSLMGSRCSSSGANEALPSSHPERSSPQFDKAAGAGFSVFKRLLSRERKIFPTEQEMGICSHAIGASSGSTSTGS